MKQFIKKVLSVSLCATLIGSTVNFFPMIAMNNTMKVSAISAETSASSFYYQENDDGSITITGFNGSETDVIIPQEIEGKSVTAIGDYAFYFCKNIINVKIPDSVISVGDAPFIGCEKIQKITIGKNFTRINNAPNDITQLFSGCDSLTEIIVNPDNNVFSSENGVLFDKEKTTILFCSRNKVGDYSIPSSVKSIGMRAFSGCTKLTSIIIPTDVHTIGYQAFYYCIGLTDIILPEAVKYIDAEAFDLCTGLTEITLPNSLVYIGKNAFQSCRNLLNITLSNNIKRIDGFSNCPKLTSVHIPNNVNKIENYAFAYCTALTSVYIPDSVKSIGSSSFSGCNDLTIYCSVGSYAETFANSKGFKVVEYDFSNENIPNNDEINAEDDITDFVYYIDDYSNTAHITKYTGNDKSVIIPDKIYNKSVTSIENYAFQNCDSIKNVVMPDSITSIGEQAFSNCNSLESISISKNLTSISSDAFSNCINLTSVSIPDSVIEIYWAAFKNCTNLRSVNLSKSVRNIYDSAFEDCPNIEEFVVDNENSSFASIDGVLFDKEKTILIKYPPAKSDTSYIVPSTVCGIGFDAFRYCNNLTEITISDNTDEMLYNLSFGGCKNLTAINANDTCRYFSSEDGVLYNKDKTELLMFPAGKSGEFIVPDTVTKLGDQSLWLANNITKIAVPDSVKEADCSMDNPKFVIYGHSGSYIESYANSNRFPFVDDYVIINNTIYDPREIFTPASSFEYTAQNGNVIITKFIGTETDVSIPIIINGMPVTSIGNNAFQGNDKIESITIPYGVTSIGNNAFQKCYGLTNIDIPDSVTSIGNYAFYSCGGLTSITIPNHITNIGNYVFYNCNQLQSISIPENVTSIGNYAFYGCFNVRKIVIPNNVTTIGSYAFDSCTLLNEVKLSDNLTNIGSYAFWGCKSLKNITIPNRVSSIGSSAFLSCSGLTSITIPESVTSIGNFAFKNCSAIKNVYLSENMDNLGSGIFKGCKGLVNSDGFVIVNNIVYDYIGANAQVVIPENIVAISGAFDGCKALKSVIIPNSVKKIYAYSFASCIGLNNITLPESITTIDDFAFSGCTGLTSINIPNSVTSIGFYAFNKCTGLNRVVIPDSVSSISKYAFNGCNNFTIYGKSGTIAETFATDNNISFVQIVEYVDSVAPTCIATGKQGYYHNLFDGKDYEDDNSTIEIFDVNSWGIIPAIGHNFELVNEKTPTCTENGEKVYKCNKCGENKTETIEPTGHSYSITVVSPTCTEQGYTIHTCSKCGNSFKDTYTKATGHDFKLASEKEPTCTENGEKIYKCSKCGENKTEIIEPTGHSYKTTTVSPTSTEQGYTIHTCSVCGDTYKDNYTAKILTNTSTLSSERIKLGEQVVANGSATGGTGEYLYQIVYKQNTQSKWTTAQSYNTNASVSFKPAKATIYDVCVKVKDSNGTEAKKFFTINVIDTLKNTSTLSATTIYLGGKITANGSATGGTGKYSYQIVYKQSTQSKWTTAQSYNTNANVSFKPAKATVYDVCVKVKDSDGTEVKKFFTVNVEMDTLKNESTISETTISLGSMVTVNAKATGSTGFYTYAVYYKKTSESKWTTKQDFKSNNIIDIKPAKATTYDICIKVKDDKGTVVKKYFEVNVTDFINTSELSTTEIKLGDTVKVSCSATGSTGFYQYAVYYKKTSNTKWTTKQSYSSNNSVSIKPTSATTYDICVKVKDNQNNEVKKYFIVTVK